MNWKICTWLVVISLAAGMNTAKGQQAKLRSQLDSYLKETIGPLAWTRAGVSAAIDQKRNDPADWAQGGAAYAKRFASNFGQVAIGNSVQYGLGSVLHLDTSYHRRGSGSYFSRFGYAAISSVTALDDSGRRVLSIPSIAGPYAGAWAATGWQPGPIRAYDVLHTGNRCIAAKAAVNILREFIFKGR